MVQESVTTVILPFLTEIVMHMQGYCEIPTTNED